ncbi:MAG: glycosyltransferase family 9 protein [Chitinispirillaceae bacterium]|nr:glycosyltransferase family 9 protein [Chitinispirillaceae bacterium]
MIKILIIRFSSIGDIIQCMSILPPLKASYPDAKIHWIARADMAPLLKIDTRIDRIWEVDRKDGFNAFVKTAWALRKEGFTHIYDAHSNIRSNIVKLALCPLGICAVGRNKQLATRPKDRLKRLLLFHLRVNLFPKPFRSFASFIEPLGSFSDYKERPVRHDALTVYRFPTGATEKVDALLLPLRQTAWICLVPSAAWELKRWSIDYWKRLVEIIPAAHFVVIGGPLDVFCDDIAKSAPERVVNLAGRTSLVESLYVIYKAPYVISGDTGFLHAADLFHKPGQALIGPTAFGFPTGGSMKVTEVDLPCRPCTKDGNGRCRNREYKKCLMDITPEMVKSRLDCQM